jgi:hypothetical protein
VTRPRFTLRWLMVAVVIVAIAIPIAIDIYISKSMDDFYGPGDV